MGREGGEEAVGGDGQGGEAPREAGGCHSALQQAPEARDGVGVVRGVRREPADGDARVGRAPGPDHLGVVHPDGIPAEAAPLGGGPLDECLFISASVETHAALPSSLVLR